MDDLTKPLGKCSSLATNRARGAHSSRPSPRSSKKSPISLRVRRDTYRSSKLLAPALACVPGLCPAIAFNYG